MTEANGSLVALVAHARRVPASDRLRLGELIRQGRARGLVLETCHRVELYASDTALAADLLAAVPDGVAVHRGDAAARHAIDVAVGLDSVVLGEDQILHQLRAATAAARAAGDLEPDVERLMNVALRAGRTARSWRTGPAPTLADAALDAVRRRGVEARGARILVVGAGQMGRLAAERARSLGATVSLSSRSDARAVDLAADLGVAPAPLDPGAAASAFDAVLVALSGPWDLTPVTIEAFTTGPAVLVDLSMPQAVPTVLASSLADRFVSIDGLAAETSVAGSPRDHARIVELVERSLADYRRWAEARDRRSMAEALVERAEARRAAELDWLWRSQPGIDAEARQAIERMSRHLTDRLLREPLERLGDDDDGRATRAVRDLFAL